MWEVGDERIEPGPIAAPAAMPAAPREGGGGPPAGAAGAGDQTRALKETKVLKLQQSIVARVPRQSGWCPEHPDFEDALADLCVRMKLYTQLSGLVEADVSSIGLD